jgi:O-antigen/teichoic acid export membrane protein
MAKIVRYAVPLGLASMLGTLTMQLHAVIVAAVCTPEQFAVYINGAIELPVIGIVTGSISTIVFSEMSSACARGDRAAALIIFREASIRSACVLLPCLFYVLVAAEPFIVFLYSDTYRESVLPFRLYLFVLPIRIVVYGAALMSLGMTRDILIRSVLDLLVNGVVCFTFVHLWGYSGAAASLAVTLYIWSTPFNLYRIGRGFGVRWYEVLPLRDLARIALICFLAAPLAAVGTFGIPGVPPIVRVATGATVFATTVGTALYLAGYITVPQRIQWLVPSVLRRLAVVRKTMP